MREFALAVAVGLSVLGCSAAAPATESGPSSQPSPASVELLTGDTGCYAGGEQGGAGLLVVDPEHGTRFNGKPVLWPRGFTGARVGSEVEVRDRAGNAVARTGQAYYISVAAVVWDSETHKLVEEIGAYPAAVLCEYEWDFVDCATGPASYCEVIPPPPSPTPEPIVLDAARAGPVLCDALTALAAVQHEHVAPLVKLIADNVPPGTPDEPLPPWSADDSAAAKEHGLAITETIAAQGRLLANLESPDLEALMAATKETYRLYGEAMAPLQRDLDGLPGGDFIGISGPLASFQDGAAALRTALDLAAEADAKGTIDCAVSAP